MKPRITHDEVAGTTRGYQWHMRRKESACDDCTAGNTAGVQERRDLLRPDHLVKVPLNLLGQLLAAVPEQDRSRFEERLGELADRAARVR